MRNQDVSLRRASVCFGQNRRVSQRNEAMSRRCVLDKVIGQVSEKPGTEASVCFGQSLKVVFDKVTAVH